METLTDFKRALENGAVVTMRRYEMNGREVDSHSTHPRRAEEVRRTYAVMEGGSRLDFGKASQWTFRPGLATWYKEWTTDSGVTYSILTEYAVTMAGDS